MSSLSSSFFESRNGSRVVFGFLAVMAATALVLGIKNFGVSVKKPFAYGNASTQDAEVLRNQQVAKLKAQDTDADGLSDYDELNLYQTSPYIADTNSDGLSDGDAVKAGIDPTCPKGQDCTGFGSSVESTTPGSVSASPANSGTTPLDITALRSQLAASGVSAQVLASVSDEELAALYEQTVGETGVNPVASNELAPPADATADRRVAESLAQLRALLKANGVDETVVDRVDDAALAKIIQLIAAVTAVADPAKITIRDIRSLLKTQGADAALVDAMDDAVLRQFIEGASISR